MARGSVLLALAAPHSTVQASLTSICASKDYDRGDDADGFKRMRVTLLEEPLMFEPPSNAQVGSSTLRLGVTCDVAP